jgi:hypothetical protein
MGFEHISESALAVELDVASQVLGVRSGESDAGVDGSLVGGGGFRFDQAAEQMQEGRLLAPRPSEERAHGNCRNRERIQEVTLQLRVGVRFRVRTDSTMVIKEKGGMVRAKKAEMRKN